MTRSRLLFERCVDGDVQLVGAGYSYARAPRYVLSEWVKLAYAQTLGRDC